MTDVFISYAHEDQNFVRRIAPALEAEGFTVWWDHTIPPGQTWDTFIARGIEDARCCVVLWSGHSVGSDWVKEEATLAKDANKLIPVQLDAESPPVGFRRIQAAQLIGWNGDVNNKQWKMLVQEVRRIVSASRAAGGATPPRAETTYTTYTPARETSKGPPWAIIGAVAAVAVLAVLGFTMLPHGQTTTSTAVETAEATGASTTTPPAPAPATTTTTATPDTAEIERLRRERDAALERERTQRAEVERMQQERARRPAVTRSTSPIIAIVGTWTTTSSACAGSGDWRFSWSGDILLWERNRGSGWETRTRQRATIKASGYVGFEPVEGNAFEVIGDTLYLHYDSGSESERQCEYSRR